MLGRRCSREARRVLSEHARGRSTINSEWERSLIAKQQSHTPWKWRETMAASVRVTAPTWWSCCWGGRTRNAASPWGRLRNRTCLYETRETPHASPNTHLDARGITYRFTP
eukprot:4023223-Prymnesium_polylepis.1